MHSNRWQPVARLIIILLSAIFLEFKPCAREIPFGTIGSVTAVAAAFGILAVFKRRKQ